MSAHLILLTDIARIIGEAETLQGVLDRVVALVAGRMRTDLCSIWLLNGARTRLTLGATEGLSQDSVGHATLEKGQGQTWQVLQRLAPLMIEDAPAAPHYHYLPETKEEEFHSFLGLPLQVRGHPIGVLCVQNREPRRFTDDEVRALAAIASQIAPVVDNARLLSLMAGGEPTLQPPDAPPAHARRFTGTPCSSGVVAGRLLRLGDRPPRRPAPTGSPEDEGKALDRACRLAREELLRMQNWLRERHAEEAALVFSVQLMLLDDPSFVGQMRQAVRDGRAAFDAIDEVTARVLDRFAHLNDVFFRERADDVRDLTGRLLRHVQEPDPSDGDQPLRGRIAVLPLLTPSRMVSLCAEGIAGVLAGGGGATSHAALLARSLDLPLVVGLGDFVHEVRSGQDALVDASTGDVVLDPPRELVDEMTRAATAGIEALRRLVPDKAVPCPIRIEANVSLWGDAVRARQVDADGIGLYRTEFAFLMRPDLPGEEEQYVLYRRIVEEVAPRPVTFRFLDAGGDKLVPALALAPEPNPFLGYRSLRLLLDHPEILGAQTRAILHALEGTEGRLLVPMVGSVAEFDGIRESVAQEGLPLPSFGAMIEVPSALMQLDELAEAADFLCVGTNDLTQHLLGVDRTNARVTRYFDVCHPAVIRALHTIVGAARRARKPISVCGEAASNPMLLPLWLGLGVDRLSVHASRVTIMRVLASRIDLAEARTVAEGLARLASGAEIRERVRTLIPADVMAAGRAG